MTDLDELAARAQTPLEHELVALLRRAHDVNTRQVYRVSAMHEYATRLARASMAAVSRFYGRRLPFDTENHLLRAARDEVQPFWVEHVKEN